MANSPAAGSRTASCHRWYGPLRSDRLIRWPWPRSHGQLGDNTIFDRFRSNYYAVRVGAGIRSAGNGTPAAR
ncbi:hypothetical protein AB0I81_00340 [Nonomuraea sp. NPDC050404]|uniref:hypothetical protein n=1 Tax=Nonomuraea sp. NPDC050404 TaxID=3155783 RepID=UPI0033E5C5F3